MLVAQVVWIIRWSFMKEEIAITTMGPYPFIYSNIPVAPAYGVYISQLIRYSTACRFFREFHDRGLLLTRKLLDQGFLLVATITWFTFMEYQCHQWPRICSTCHKHFPVNTAVPLVERKLRVLPEYLSSPRFSCYSFSFMCVC